LKIFSSVEVVASAILILKFVKDKTYSLLKHKYPKWSHCPVNMGVGLSTGRIKYAASYHHCGWQAHLEYGGTTTLLECGGTMPFYIDCDSTTAFGVCGGTMPFLECSSMTPQVIALRADFGVWR
jgi:hypothetical protein